MTQFCTILAALAGGSFQTASISRPVETGWFGRRSSATRSARCMPVPISTR